MRRFVVLLLAAGATAAVVLTAAAWPAATRAPVIRATATRAKGPRPPATRTTATRTAGPCPDPTIDHPPLLGNIPPVAAFTASPDTPAPGAVVSFDASRSHDPDGTITDYCWTFGDGAAAAGPIVTHAYAAGRFTASLVVEDNNGATSAASRTITVGSPPSGVVCTQGRKVTLHVSDAHPRRGERVTFSGSVTPRDNCATVALQRRGAHHRFADVSTVALKRAAVGGSKFSRVLTIGAGAVGTYRAELVRGHRVLAVSGLVLLALRSK